MDWLHTVSFWHWWILAGVLLILELTWPVFFFLWLSFSAAAVGFLLLVFPGIPLTGQLVLAAILAAVAVLSWRRYHQASAAAADRTGGER